MAESTVNDSAQAALAEAISETCCDISNIRELANVLIERSCDGLSPSRIEALAQSIVMMTDSVEATLYKQLEATTR